MDLIGRVAIVVVVLIVVFSGAFLLIKHNSQSSQLSQQQAEQLVLSDAQKSNPQANITVISATNASGSYNIVLSVVYNATKPCPTLFIEGFNVQLTGGNTLAGLAPSTYNEYISNCTLINSNNASSTKYLVSSPEAAIVKSYDLHLPQINDYVNQYGYANTSVTASLYSYMNNNETHLAQSYYNVWLIRYRASNANFSVYAVESFDNGTVVGNFTNST